MLEIKFWKEHKNLLDARNPFPQAGQKGNRLQIFLFWEVGVHPNSSCCEVFSSLGIGVGVGEGL